MKYPALIILFLTGIATFSCKKSNSPAPAPTIVHNWTVVSDSVYFGSNGTMYAGQYFNFTANGELSFSTSYIGTGSIKYQLTSDTTMIIGQTIANGELETIGNSGITGAWMITKLTDHALTLHADGVVPSMGHVGEIIQLSR
jgi:hypothetical protein